jgi:hypothetical protein
VANGQSISVRVLAYHIAGLELRHMNTVRDPANCESKRVAYWTS